MELSHPSTSDEGSTFCERIPEDRSCPLGRVRTRTTVAKAASSVVGALKVEDGIVRNVGTGGREEPVDDLSGVLKKEVTNPRKDTPFVVLISLLATLALARGFVLLTGAAEATTGTSTYLGRNLIINGYHIHHFFYGFVLICAAAWIAIQYPTRNLPRVAAVLFGAGLGLCVDEMGYFLGGQVNYFDQTTYFIALSIILVLLSAVSFRSFRAATQEDLRWLVGRRPRGIAVLAVLQILASLALSWRSCRFSRPSLCSRAVLCWWSLRASLRPLTSKARPPPSLWERS